MPDITPTPRIPAMPSTPNAPERLQERPSGERRHKRKPEGDLIELHDEHDADVPAELEPVDPVEEPVHIDLKA